MERTIDMETTGKLRCNVNMTGMPIMTSRSERIVRVPHGAVHPMSWGDRVFVRLTQGSRILAEYLNTRVSDMTEVLGDVRRRVRGHKGLARLQVRNATEGWSVDRPLMLYADRFAPRGFGNVRIHELAIGASVAKTMLKPWETH